MKTVIFLMLGVLIALTGTAFADSIVEDTPALLESLRANSQVTIVDTDNVPSLVDEGPRTKGKTTNFGGALTQPDSETVQAP